jgi:hypothetical protein
MYQWHISTYVVLCVKLIANSSSSTTKPQSTGIVHARLVSRENTGWTVPHGLLSMLDTKTFCDGNVHCLLTLAASSSF